MLEQTVELEKIFYSIREVAEMFNVNQSLLRFWEGEFDTLQPRKNKRGDRFYDKEDIETFRQIHQLVKIQGYTLQGARQIISGNKKEIKANVTVRETLVNMKSFLQELHDTL